MRRSLTYFWRTNLAVAAGAAVATAVLTGALLVGDSVRGSLRELTVDRLGGIHDALVSERPFREALAEDLARATGNGVQLAPVLLVRGSAVHGETGTRASNAAVFGIDERLGELYPQPPEMDLSRRPGLLLPPVILNRALAHELGAISGDEVLISFAVPSDIPRETLVGRQEAADTVATLRLSVGEVIDDRGLGGLTLVAQQTRTLNAFVDLRRLQRALFGRRDTRRVNLLFAGRPAEPGALERALSRAMILDDLGLELTRRPGESWLTLTSREFVLAAAAARAARAAAAELGATAQPVLTYLANSIRAGERSIPYSTISALDPPVAAGLGAFRLRDGGPVPRLAENEILLNGWAADDLEAKPGDEITVDYYVLGARDELSTASVRLRLRGVVAMEGLAVDPGLTPEFPGLHDAEDISAWEPPFPVDLDLIRPADESYWDDYRSVPKAFVAEALGRRLWKSRFGELTSVRFAPGEGLALEELETRLRGELPALLAPEEAGFGLRPLRQEGLRAAEGATDFAGLFLGLSMFLIASAALLVGLLFRLGVERRAKEVGLLRAVGYRARSVSRALLQEGGLLAALGGLAGLGGALLYAWLMLVGLRTWWLPAVGTPVLFLHVEPLSLAVGWLASLLVVVATIWWTLRKLRRLAAPRLLAGSASLESGARGGRRARWLARIFAALALALIGLALVTGEASSPGYAFGVGASILVAGLAAFADRCGGARRGEANELGSAALVGMGARNTGRNRTRSTLSVALVGCAAFLIVVVAAHRGGEPPEVTDPASGAGGFTLMAETDVPIHVDLDRPERRRELGFAEPESAALEGVTLMPFRLLPGEDVSCLNLFRPERPRILGVPPEMIERGGFTFQQTAGRAPDPWALLEGEIEPGVIPAFGDYNSVLWILHSGLGRDLVVSDESGAELKLRLVGLLAKGVFQSEILISEENFLRHFPGRTGYSWFLADPPPEKLDEISGVLEARLGRFGFDATPTAERLAAFQAVENTYLATFQTLGGLGLLLGTVGLGIVLLRNVLERQGELAALRAFGYRRKSLAWMVLAENGVLLAAGVAIGTVAGLLAAAPNLLAGGGGIPWASLAATLGVVLVVGMLSAGLAVAGTLRVPLLPALKAER